MQDFIVLGIIPGTNIQLDFNDWVLISASLIVSYVLFSYVVRHVHKLALPLRKAVNTNTALIGPIETQEALA